MAKLSPLTLMLVVGIVVVLMAPAILEAFTGLIGDAWDTWRDLFPTADTGEATGYSGLGLTIHYTDGSKKELKPSIFSTIPLEIVDTGGTVSKITAIIYITPTSTQPAVQWTVIGDLKVEYMETTAKESVLASETKAVRVLESATWQSGVERPVQSFSFLASHIEDKVKAYGENQYRMKFTCDIELTFTFEDGSTDAKAATADSSWTFDYTTGTPSGGELTSISLRVGSAVLRPGGSADGK